MLSVEKKEAKICAERLSSEGTTIFVAHSVAPKAQTVGFREEKSKPQRGVIFFSPGVAPKAKTRG